MQPQGHLPGKQFAHLLIGALIVSAFCFLAPLPGFKEFRFLVKALCTNAPIAIAGNSVIGYVSRCDSDKRTLQAMIQDQMGKKTTDLDYGGESLDDSIQYAATALHNPRNRTVIVLLSLFDIQRWNEGNLQRYLFFKLLNPSLDEASLRSRFHLKSILTGEGDPLTSAFRYKGTDYPDYVHIWDTYFERESGGISCPEGDGRDLRFIEAYYYHSYLGFPVQVENYNLLKSLQDDARRSGKQLLLVISPIDYTLIAKLNPDIATGVRRRNSSVFHALTERKINVLDLGDALQGEDFAGRYCACGHLAESGRRKVALAIGDALISTGGR